MREAERQMRRNLADAAGPHLGDEPIRVLAIGQARFGGWAVFLPMGIGIALVIQSGLIGDERTFPIEAGYVGVAVVLAWAVGMSLIPMRLVVRTDPQLCSFALSRSAMKAAKSGPIELAAPLASLPADPSQHQGGSGSIQIGSERIFPQGGRRLERAALAEAISATPGTSA